MNDTRSRIFKRNRTKPVYLFVLVSFCAQSVTAPVAALADVPSPPPNPPHYQNSGFPSERALQNMGYDAKSGVWRVNETKQGKAKVEKDGNTIKGEQAKKATVTGKYGEKATISTTQTQRVNVGKIETVLGGTLAAATAAGGAIGSDFAASAYQNAKQGDWGGFARDAFGAVLEGLSKLDFTGLGGGINQFLDKTGIREGASAGQLKQASDKAAAAQAQAERAGDFRAAVANAAAAKAAQGAAEAAKKAEAEKQAEKEANAKGLYAYDLILMKRFQPNIYASESSTTYKSYKVYSNNSNYHIWGNGFITNGGFYHNYNSSKDYSIKTGLENPSKISLEIKNLPNNSQIYYEISSYPAGSPDIPDAAKNAGQVNLSDLTLNQKEMIDILRRMLESNQTNHAELMSQLSRMGNVVPSATESNTYTPASATSAPYTPAGSNTAQQTRFNMDAQGNITAETVARPDLKPNSSQAPTRSPIIPDTPAKPSETAPDENPSTPTRPTTPTSPTTPANPNSESTTSNQNQEQNKEFCQANPNAAICQDLGDGDYEDIEIPEQQLDLNLKPLDVFRSDGICPGPVSIKMGGLGSFELGYDELCNVLRMLRPILIICTVITCSFFAYNATKEL